MKDCDSIQQDLSAYVDGALTGMRVTVLEAHLGQCADCRAQVAGLRQLAQGVAALPRLPVPPAFLRDVRQKIADGQGQPWGRPLGEQVWWKMPLGALALVVVLVTVGVFYHSSQPREQADDWRAGNDREETKAKAEASGSVATGRRVTILADAKESRQIGAESPAKRLADKPAESPTPVLQLAPPSAAAPVARKDEDVARFREREVPAASAPAEVTEQAHAVAAPTPVAPQLESPPTSGGGNGLTRGVPATAAGELALAKKEQSPVVSTQIPLKTRDVEAARHRVAGVAAHAQGRVLSWDAQRQVVQVELPAKNVDLFAHALNPPLRLGLDRPGRYADDRLAAPSPTAATPPATLTSRAAVATGTVATGLVAGAKLDGGVAGAGAVLTKTSSNVVVEVLILPVKSAGQ